MTHNDKRPLFTLTVEEFIELNKSINNDITVGDIKPKEELKQLQDIIYIDDASQMAGYTPSTTYTKVCKREMPVVSRGRPLTFSRKGLEDWIAKGRPSIAEMIAEDYMNSKNQK
jgi:hypothetical protein